MAEFICILDLCSQKHAAKQMLSYQLFLFFNYMKDAVVQPSLVIVYFGGNDSMEPHPSGLGPHVPLPEYIDNMKKIALHLKVHYISVSLYYN